MGRIVVTNFISIDGVIQSPLSPDEDRDGGFEHGGWVPPYSDETVEAFMENSTTDATAMLLGRVSYEHMAAAWSDADKSEPAIAAMNQMPKYVVTSSPIGSPWANSHVIGSDISRVLPDLKQRTDGDLAVFGAGTLVRGLAERDLVDEYRLLMFPVILGAGKRMFDERGHFARFELSSSVTARSGVTILTFTHGPVPPEGPSRARH